MPYTVNFRGPARKALSETLPEAVAAAAYEFCIGPVAVNPRRVGHQLHAPLEGYHSARRGTYRVVYVIDDEQSVVWVEWIGPRSDVYRAR